MRSASSAVASASSSSVSGCDATTSSASTVLASESTGLAGDQAERAVHCSILPSSVSKRGSSAREILIGANGAACEIEISPSLRSSSRARNATACSTRERPFISASKSKRRRRSEHGPEPFHELRDGREPKRHVRQRDARWLDGQAAHRLDEAERLLRGKPTFRARGEGCRPEPEVELALLLEPLAQPDGGELHAPVLREATCELFGSLLRLQLRELRLLVGEQMSSLQLEQRRDQDEELAAGVEVELVALGEPLDEGDDDPGHVDLRRLDRVLEQEREKEVEGPLEGIEVQLEVADGAGHDRTLAPGSDAALRHVHPGSLRRLHRSAPPPPL